MRITVGHVLILGGVAAYFALGSVKGINKSGIKNEANSFVSSMKSLVDLFKSEAPPSPLPKSNETVVEPKTAVDVAPEVAPEPVPAAPAALEAEKSPATAPKKRVSKKKKPKAAKKPAAGSAQQIKDPLIGTYVSLTLKSGREVKGILESRTASTYQIQLPGMGPFTYNVNSVVKIEPAK